MGTSTSFGGGKNFNPLIPNWLDPDSTEETIAVQNNILADQPELSQVTSENIESNFQPNELQVDNRYSTARRNFTAFINSGGSDRAALGRAIASYVHKTSGGAKQAAKRMKSERQASVRLSNILSMASTNGIQSVIKSLNLENLANRPITEIYAALTDIICPMGGDLDDAIVRDAYIEAIGEVAEMGLADLEKPSATTIATIMECFISNAIKDRIMNAIATKIITLPNNVYIIQNIENQLKDFIRGAVSDAMTHSSFFSTDQTTRTMNSVYERAFTVLEALAQQEAEQ
ncbi:TPA: hypothetical protein I8Y95_001739 [Legionella pneumophila]|nr:hypothetical protein [Legionella pneumophila]HAT1760449.1 hypothetical protein [Legionella pneumophila]HAT1763317.1 hypothetical protein [Legionella pneumophila]HAT1766387.1 hypothetical protein [Legionella pneumophila]HAT1812227.1 hypothetical protein [Legionella pneumophila]